MIAFEDGRTAYYQEKCWQRWQMLTERAKRTAERTGSTRRTGLKPEKLYPQYRQNSGEPAEISALNTAAEDCRKMGFVTMHEINQRNCSLCSVWQIKGVTDLCLSIMLGR